MKIANISKTRKLNQVSSLPNIYNYRNRINKIIKNNIINNNSLNNNSINNNSINNISSTNITIVKSRKESSLISNRNLIKLKKIKLNDKYNSQRSLNNSVINPSNTNKKTIEILNNADKLMKDRLKYNGYGRSLLKSVALKTSKDVCYKNYTISLLKERRIKLNKKEYLINEALHNFAEQYEKDNKRFANFIEEIKSKQRKEEDNIIELKQIREKTEKLYEEQKLLNKKLYETLERNIRDLYILKCYGSFFHKIINKKFIYDGTPEINAREKNHELLSDLIIDIFENEDENNELPKELGNADLFMKEFIKLEDKILSGISIKEILDKEKEKINIKYKNELEQLKISKDEYESDLNYLENEIKKVKMEMQNYKIHRDENFDNYLNYIIELGKEVGTNVEIPKIIDKKYLTELVLLSKNIINILENKEEKINKNILEIDNVLNYGEKQDKVLIKTLIINQKNKNKRENQLKIKKKQEEIKKLKNLQILERAKKIVLTGRKIIVDYPRNSKKFNNKELIKKENNDDDIDYRYSSENKNDEN